MSLRSNVSTYIIMLAEPPNLKQCESHLTELLSMTAVVHLSGPRHSLIYFFQRLDPVNGNLLFLEV